MPEPSELCCNGGNSTIWIGSKRWRRLSCHISTRRGNWIVKSSNRTFMVLASAMVVLFILGLILVLVLATRQ